MTTVKYHISSIDGQARRCTAKSIETCRAEKPEGLDEHYSTIQEAQAAYENSQINLSLSPFKKPLNLPKIINMDAQEFDEDQYKEDCRTYFEELNMDELKSLKYYVSDGYGDINGSLYGTIESSPKLDKEIKTLDSALSKSNIKPPKTVWRTFGGGKLNKEFHNKGYKVGDTVEFNGFTSTTQTSSGIMGMKNSQNWYMEEVDSEKWERKERGFGIKLPEEYAENGTEGRNVVLCIRPKNGAPVSMLRGQADEQEWLLPRDSKFKVSEIYENRTLKGKNLRSDHYYAHVYVLDQI